MLNRIFRRPNGKKQIPEKSVIYYHPNVAVVHEPSLHVNAARDLMNWHDNLTPSLPLGVSESSRLIDGYLAGTLAEYGSLTAKDWGSGLLVDIAGKALHLQDYEVLINELDMLRSELDKQVALVRARWASADPDNRLIPWEQAKEELRSETSD